jgi:hypothetical protein
LRFFRLGILWCFLFLLASFVLFVEFVADVPGNAEPVPKPTPPAETPAPSPMSAAYDQLIDSSSNTRSPLS